MTDDLHGVVDDDGAREVPLEKAFCCTSSVYLLKQRKGRAMSTPSSAPNSTQSAPTPVQADIIQTAAAIHYVLSEHSLREIMRHTQTLTPDQIDEVTRRFEDGVTRWQRSMHSHTPPDALEISQIAIIADYLSNKHPNGIVHNAPGKVTVNVDDIRESLQQLSGDVSHLTESRARWEGLARAMHVDEDTTTVHAARNVGMLIARSLGVDGIFSNAFNAGEVPLAEVDPLPAYSASDPRGSAALSRLMGQLQLELSVTDGILQTLTPDEPGETHERHLVKWFQDRAVRAIDKARDLVIPGAISRLGSRLSDKQKILKQSHDLLNTCIYGTEQQLASIAAQHAVERSFGTILFLSICPNVPFVIPTLELRLAITKPLYFVTRGAHEALGNIPLFGLMFLLLRGMGEFIDAIPRAQVRLVQGIVTESWIAKPKKRAQLIERYLRYIDRRATKPQIDAVQNLLLSLVS